MRRSILDILPVLAYFAKIEELEGRTSNLCVNVIFKC